MAMVRGWTGAEGAVNGWGQDTGLSRGTIYSGAGHVGLILWVMLGDWLFPHSEPPAIESMSVSTLTSAEFEAMQSSAPAPSGTEAPEQAAAAEPEGVPVPPAVEPTVEPEPRPAAETPPAPEAAPAEPEPVPDPVPAEPVADPAPDDVVLAPEEQPIPTMSASMRPKPKPAPIVAPDPVAVPEDAPTAETPTEATSEEPAETPPEVIEEPQPDAVAEETGDVLETEATEEQEEALGMASSPRPKAKPNRPAPAVPAETATAAAEPASTEATDAAAEAAIAAALAEAAAEEDAAGGSAAPSASGPPLNAGEIGDVRAAIGGKWSLGAVSTDTMRTTIVVRVSFDPTGKPTDIQLLESDGPSQAATDTAFSAARSAIIRAAREGGIPFPPDKYETWKVVDFVFDPSGMRFR